MREEGSKGEGDTINDVFYILHNEHYITVGSYTISSAHLVAIRKHKITLLFDETSEHSLESQEFYPDTWECVGYLDFWYLKVFLAECVCLHRLSSPYPTLGDYLPKLSTLGNWQRTVKVGFWKQVGPSGHGL